MPLVQSILHFIRHLSSPCLLSRCGGRNGCWWVSVCSETPSYSEPWLVWNSVFRPGRPGTHSNVLASASWVLGWQMWATRSSWQRGLDLTLQRSFLLSTNPSFSCEPGGFLTPWPQMLSKDVSGGESLHLLVSSCVLWTSLATKAKVCGFSLFLFGCCSILV